MKVIMLENKKTVDVNDGYGLRLVEQGKAIPVEAKEPVQKVQEPKSFPKKEAKDSKK